MSKEYLCKDCEYNNNGWCSKLKFNGLKRITECEHKKVEGYLSNEGQKEYNAVTDNLYKDIDYEPYKNMGKREIFYNIQMQLSAMEDSLTVADVKRIMISLEQVLLIGEQIHGIETEYEMDRDIIEGSKSISEYWNKKYGSYKGSEIK